jgi:hypothetical protein
MSLKQFFSGTVHWHIAPASFLIKYKNKIKISVRKSEGIVEDEGSIQLLDVI